MATTLELLDIAIQAAAITGIASVTIDGQTVQTRSLKELIEWRELLISQTSATRVGGGLRLQQITPIYK